MCKCKVFGIDSFTVSHIIFRFKYIDFNQQTHSLGEGYIRQRCCISSFLSAGLLSDNLIPLMISL